MSSFNLHFYELWLFFFREIYIRFEVGAFFVDFFLLSDDSPINAESYACEPAPYDKKVCKDLNIEKYYWFFERNQDIRSWTDQELTRRGSDNIIARISLVQVSEVDFETFDRLFLNEWESTWVLEVILLYRFLAWWGILRSSILTGSLNLSSSWETSLSAVEELYCF